MLMCGFLYYVQASFGSTIQTLHIPTPTLYEPNNRTQDGARAKGLLWLCQQFESEYAEMWYLEGRNLDTQC